MTTANTKSVRNYVRNMLATSDVRVCGTWTDNNSMPGHRNVTFRLAYDNRENMVEAFHHIALGLAFEGIPVKCNYTSDCTAYLRLNRVRFEG